MKTRILVLLLALFALCGRAHAQNPICPQFNFSVANGFTATCYAGASISSGQILTISGNSVVPITAGATSGVFAIALQNASSGGILLVMLDGQAQVSTDNACTETQFIIVSSSTNGSGHCTSSPGTNQWAATAMQTTSGASAPYASVSPMSTGEAGTGGGSSFPVTTAVAVNSGGSITVNTGASIVAAGTGTITATNGVGNGAAPNVAIYFSASCPATDPDGVCIQSFGDTKIDGNHCSWSGTTITCSDGPFLSTDCVGGSGCTGTGTSKRIMGFGSCQGDLLPPSNSPMFTTTAATIATYISSTQITVSATPTNNVASAGCVVWGHSDDTAAASVDTLLGTTPYCAKVMLANANYWFSQPHFYTNPAGCPNLPSQIGAANAYGNLIYPNGMEVEGRGPGTTNIWLGNDFPGAGNCTHTTGPAATNACFVIPVMGKWSDLQISGGGQSACQVSAGTNLIYADVGTIENVTLTNFCNTRTQHTVGIMMDFLTQLYQVNSSGFGDIGLETVNATAYSQGFKVAVENSTSYNLFINGTTAGAAYTFQCFGCIFDGAQSTTGIITIENNAGILKLWGGVIAPAPTGSGTSPSATLLGVGTAGAINYLHDVTMVNTNSSTTTTGLACLAKCTNYLENTTLACGASGGCFYDGVSTSVTYDLGGNSNIFSGSGTTLFGTYIADGHSLFGACTGTATASSTLGLYGTGPNETTTTCTSTTIGGGIPLAAPRTLQGLKVTASHAGVSASSGVVTVMRNGSASTITCTIGTGTGCTDTTHSVSASAGDLISIEFTTQASEVLAGVQAELIWQ